MPTKEFLKRPEISFWVALLLPFVGFAVQWGVLTTNINAIADKGIKLRTEVEAHINIDERRYESQNETFLKIQVQLAEIQKDIAYIKNRIAEEYN